MKTNLVEGFNLRSEFIIPQERLEEYTVSLAMRTYQEYAGHRSLFIEYLEMFKDEDHLQKFAKENLIVVDKVRLGSSVTIRRPSKYINCPFFVWRSKNTTFPSRRILKHFKIEVR